jgi:hypothetical protein
MQVKHLISVEIADISLIKNNYFIQHVYIFHDDDMSYTFFINRIETIENVRHLKQDATSESTISVRTRRGDDDIHGKQEWKP